MRARWAVPAALAVVLACAPARAELRARTRDLGAVSPVVSLLALEQGGSADWGAGIRTPTTDCAAVGTSSAASLQCSGATPSFAGPGQAAAGSPWWYRGDTAVRPAIALNGSTDYWTLGDVGDTDSNVAACVAFRPDALSGVTYLVGKTNNSTGPWGIYQSSGSLRVWVVKAGGGYTEVAFGTVTVGTWYEACFSYAYVADGSSVIRTTLNGVPGTPSTTTVGPLENTAHNLAIGSITNGTLKFAGAIRRVAIWTGADAPTSAAQLAQMVATQWGLAADKPAGTVATHARTDSTLCCPFSDAECFWVGPGAPCIHAPSYSGWAGTGGGIEVFGVGANGLSTSSAFGSWTESGTAGVSADSHAAPDLTSTADTITTTGANSIRYLAATVTSSAGPFTHAAWSRSVSGTATVSVAVECYPQTVSTCTCGRSDGAACTAEKVNSNFDCSAYSTVGTTPVRVWATATCAAAVTGPLALVAPGRWRTSDGTAVFWGAQLTPTAYPVPYRATTGTAYAGIASTATTLTVPVALTDPARWAISLGYLPAALPTTSTTLWWMGASGNIAGSTANASYLSGGYMGSFNAAAQQAYTAWTPQATTTSLTMLSDNAGGLLTVRAGGAVVSGAMQGAGTGVATLPTSIYVGASGDGTRQQPGLYQRLVQCRRAGGCR